MAETQKHATFIIDCPWCKAKVAAIEHGRGKKQGWIDGPDEPYGEIIAIGECLNCGTLLEGASHQFAFDAWDSSEDSWTDFVRVFPGCKPEP
jgi:hypothetical protein